MRDQSLSVTPRPALEQAGKIQGAVTTLPHTQELLARPPPAGLREVERHNGATTSTTPGDGHRLLGDSVPAQHCPTGASKDACRCSSHGANGNTSVYSQNCRYNTTSTITNKYPEKPGSKEANMLAPVTSQCQNLR